MAPLYPYRLTVPVLHSYNIQVHVPNVSVLPWDNSMNKFLKGFILGALLWVAFSIAYSRMKYGVWMTMMVLDGTQMSSESCSCRCSMCPTWYNEKMTEEVFSMGNGDEFNLLFIDYRGRREYLHAIQAHWHLADEYITSLPLCHLSATMSGHPHPSSPSSHTRQASTRPEETPVL